MCLCASVLSGCVCGWGGFFYNLQSPRTSRMTECKYSHAVFYPKMASASSGTNIMCLKTYIQVNSIKKPLYCCQIMLQLFLLLLDQGGEDFFQTRQHVQYFIWPRPPLMTSEHRQGGSFPIKRPRTNTATWPLSHQSACKCH